MTIELRKKTAWAVGVLLIAGIALLFVALGFAFNHARSNCEESRLAIKGLVDLFYKATFDKNGNPIDPKMTPTKEQQARDFFDEAYQLSDPNGC